MLWLPFSLANALFESIANAFSKHGAQKVNVLSATWAQQFFSLLILIPLTLITHSFHRPKPEFWPALLTTATLGTAAIILFVKALKESPLSLTLPIVTFTPAFLLLTSPIIVGEFPQPLGVIGILLIVFGAYVLNISQTKSGFTKPIIAIFKEPGTRLMFLVALLWSITSNFDKIAVKNSNPFFFLTCFSLIVLMFLTLILKLQKRPVLAILKHSKTLAPMGIFNALSISAQMTAITMTIVPNVISVKRTSILFGTVWGKLFFKETNLRERLAGAAIMVLGVILITFS